MTHDDAEKAVADLSYKQVSDETLNEMHIACLNVHGPNTSAVTRIRRVGEIIWNELQSREEAKRQQQNTAYLSETDGKMMSISSGKDSETEDEKWNEERIEALIANEIEESLSLEYKAAAAISKDNRDILEITKDVSAIANSAGGVLVYGVAEHKEKQKRHKPERIDPISRAKYSKEWLEHIIAQVRPRIPNLAIHPVQLKSDPDHIAYILVIPQGTTAHQAKDFRYYRRYNFESVPMIDHEVRDVMNRRSHPQVIVSAKLEIFPHPNKEGENGLLIFKINNTSGVFARYVAMIINAPLRVGGRLIFYKKATLDEGNDGSSYRLVFSNHAGSPLFPKASLQQVFPFKFIQSMTPEPKKEQDYFRYLVFADSMPKKFGTFTTDSIIAS